MNTVLSPSRRRSGFSLIEVTLAIGILGTKATENA